MVEKNLTLPFNFFCLSDTEIEGIQTIPLDLSLDMESYWWKVCLFNTDMSGPSLYFDLDIVIQNNFDQIFDKIVQDKLLVINGEDAGQTPQEESQNIGMIPYTGINSSVIGFYANTHRDIFDHFHNNKDYHIVKYHGLDRYIYNNFKDKLSYLDYINDWYFRLNGPMENYNKDYNGASLPFVPHSKFCIVKQIEHFKYPYVGLEDFFL